MNPSQSHIAINQFLISTGLHATGYPKLVDAATRLSDPAFLALDEHNINYLIIRAMKVRMIPRFSL